MLTKAVLTSSVQALLYLHANAHRATCWNCWWWPIVTVCFIIIVNILSYRDLRYLGGPKT